MINDFVGQQTLGSLDVLFEHWPALNFLLINGYPLLSLLFNLCLLVVPFLAMAALEHYYKLTKFKKWPQKLAALALGFLWLVFIPNTAYIITDVRHLYVPDCPMSSYYRVCTSQTWTLIVFFTYACAGWLFFVWFVRRMKLFLSKIYGRAAGPYFIICLMPLISLGVALGLVERWSSWQLVNAPLSIWQSALGHFLDPLKFKNWLIFTIFLYILYYGGEVLLVKKIKIKQLR